VPPERIVDYLTLMGDAVDNVPGVEKVGPKTAAKWIAEYGSLDGVIAAAPTRSRAWPARTCARRWTGCPGPQAGHGEDRLRAERRARGRLAGVRLAGLEAGRQGAALLAFYDRYGFKT
jgi:DNA polymerase-1